MSPEQFVAVLGAITALVAALAGLFVQVRVLSRRVDGRLEQLLALTQRSAAAEGTLAGRAQVHAEIEQGSIDL